MDRTKLITALVALASVPFVQTDLEAFDDERLTSLATLAGLDCNGCKKVQDPPSDPPAANEGGEDPPAAPAPVADPSGVQQSADGLSAEELEILRGFIQGIPAVTELVSNAQRTVDAERDELVTALHGDSRCAISEADLKAMSLSALRGLSRSFMSVDYSGRGGPSSHALGANAEESGFMPAPAVVMAPFEA